MGTAYPPHLPHALAKYGFSVFNRLQLCFPYYERLPSCISHCRCTQVPQIPHGPSLNQCNIHPLEPLDQLLQLRQEKKPHIEVFEINTRRSNIDFGVN